jgi:aminopeptidase YwaD
MRKLLFAPLLLVLSGADLRTPSVDPARYLEHVKFLASEEMKGRGTGTPELEKAAAYIARQFRAAGLQALDGRGYLLEFPVTTSAKLGPANTFSFTLNGAARALKAGVDYTPLNFSASGGFRGGVVFAGYGITAREYGYDDYAGIDARDKWVMVLRHEPQEFEETSVFAGRVYTDHAQLHSKATNAKNHGARGMILVSDVANHPSEANDLDKFERHLGPNNAGIPIVHLRAGFADEWLALAHQRVQDVGQEIDKDLQPRSFALPEKLVVEAQVDVQRERRKVHNVAGYLPGETAEYVVIGAHYDHLGLGEQFTLAPSQVGTPHLGADDNASGTAGLIELARWFGSRPKMKRGVLFLAFSAEELGLLGSGDYVANPKLPLDNAVAMINMDMIGRAKDGRVYVGGLGTGTTFKPLIERLASRHPLKFEFSDQTGYGSSDHQSFTIKQVPVLFFFSGLHADYHKPSDTWEKIESATAARLVEFIGDVAGELAMAADRPQFVRVAAPPPPRGVAGAGSGYGAYFGSIPDFAEVPNGVRFADVREGSPAAKAGLKAGDILVAFDGKPIQNLYDFTYALRSKRPGEEVLVRVMRGGEAVEAKVLLEQRR